MVSHSAPKAGRNVLDAALMGAGGDLQATHFRRQIVHWKPVGKGLDGDLDGDEVRVFLRYGIQKGRTYGDRRSHTRGLARRRNRLGRRRLV